MKLNNFLFAGVILLALALTERAQDPDSTLSGVTPRPSIAEVQSTSESATAGVANASTAEFKNLSDLKWDKILPDLGADSPEICILHVDSKTQATQLFIRTPKAIHVRKHWHSANETHTVIKGTATFACDGKKAELAEGAYNFMPAKMVHEAWLPSDSLTFITVDGAWDINWVEGAPTRADLSRTY